MALKIAVAIAASAVAFFLWAAPARADFTVCNSSPYGKVHVAYAATWHDSQGTAYGQSQGWWVINTDDCRIILTNDISAYTIYIYAFADADPTHELWGGGDNYCLDPVNTFLYHGNDMDTPCTNGKEFGMRYVDTDQDETYTYYLRN